MNRIVDDLQYEHSVVDERTTFSPALYISSDLDPVLSGNVNAATIRRNTLTLILSTILLQHPNHADSWRFSLENTSDHEVLEPVIEIYSAVGRGYEDYMQIETSHEIAIVRYFGQGKRIICLGIAATVYNERKEGDSKERCRSTHKYQSESMWRSSRVRRERS